MNMLLFPLLGLLGMFLGLLLYALPFRLFYRHTTWLTEEEFLAAFPEKRWVSKALYGLVPLGFVLFASLMMSTDDGNREFNFFFFFPIFFGCMGAIPAFPELLAKASVSIPVGHNSRTPLLYTFSPNAARAGVFRLALAALVVALFLWTR